MSEATRAGKIPWPPVAVFAVLAVGILGLWTLTVGQQKRYFRTCAEGELASVADLKGFQVSAWRRLRLGLGTTILENRFFAARARDLSGGPESGRARQEIVEELEAFQQSLSFTASAIVLPGGKTVLGYPEEPGPSPETTRLGHEAYTGRKVVLSDIYAKGRPGRPCVTLFVPLLTSKEESEPPVAVLIMDFDPAGTLYPVLKAWPTPSETSETLLLAHDGRDFLLLNDPRFGSGAAISLRFPIGSLRRVGTDTSLGEEGLVSGRDYRGRNVLGFIKAVPNSPWLLMAKTDVSELDAGQGLGLGLATGILLAMIGGAGAVLGRLWRRERAAGRAAERLRMDKALSVQDEFLEVMINVMPNAAFFKNADGVVAGCNAAFEKLLNLSKDNIVGRTFADLVDDKLAEKDRETDAVLLAKPGVQVYESALKAWDGEDHHVILIKSTFARPDGSTGGLMVTLIDVTQRKRTEEEIQEIRRFTDSVVQTMTEGLILTDAEGRISFVNPAAAAMLGYAVSEMEGLPATSFVPEDQQKVVVEMDDRRALGITDRYELDFLRKDGSRRTLLVSGGPRVGGAQYGGTMAVLTDITDRKRMEERIRTLSLEDELTKLYNRRGFLTLGEQQLKSALRLKKKAYLLYADVDDLKAINDSHGHGEGDKALIRLSEILRSSFRDSDIVARIGGDEFVVLAMEANKASPDIFTKRLQDRLDLDNIHTAEQGDRRPFRLSLSFGVVTFDPEFPATIEDILVQADRRMYEAKRSKKR